MTMQTPPSSNWNYPTAVRFGVGRIAELRAACKAHSIERPLLVTDPFLGAHEMVQSTLGRCAEEGLQVSLFDGIGANPTGAQVADGVERYREGGHDAVIAFGGGSALDGGKAIAFHAGQQRPLWDFEDVGDWWTRADAEKIAPVIAIPTTAGTGSEVGRAAVILDEEAEAKKIIFHPKMLPVLVIADPELTQGLPPSLSAATGMDALAHCLEAYCAPGFHPMADGIAAEGLRLIKRSLSRVVSHGDDLIARSDMLAAAMMGATAFQKGLGAVHALSHPLGAIYHAHHGTLNGILMPAVLRRNRTAVEDRIAHLAQGLGIDGGFDGFLSWLEGLRRDISVPEDLSGVGIEEARIDEIGALATQDPSAGGNPIPLSATDYATLLRSLLP